MKKLLFILLFTPLLSFSQWSENYQMQTQWCYEFGKSEFCDHAYFSGNKNEGEIILKVKPFRDTLSNPYFYIQTSIDMFSVYIDGVNKRGFFMGKIKHHELAKIKTLKYAEAVIIWVKNGKKPPIKKIMIVDKHIREQLTELINYTKPL
jgi:hypothetical protein